MAAGNGMNMAVGLDLSQLQKDLKTLDKSLNSYVSQEKIIKIKAILEDDGKAKKGFESLHKAITELSNARANLKIDGKLVDDMSIKDAQKSLRQFRKELKDINSGKIADPSGQRATQLMTNIANIGRWVNATKASAKELANIGWVDVNRQAAKAKAARSAITKEMNRLRAEMDKLGTVSPADLKARESYLKRLINLQEQYNKTYARSPKKGTQQLADLQHELQMTRSIGENNKLLNNQVKIFDRLKTLAARYVSIYTLAHFGRKIVEITGYFDQQRVALEGIVGSAEKANELLNQIKNFALQSPKTTKELIGYTKQLAAYSIPYDELFATTRRLADLSTGLGVDMQRLILAYGQVKAAAVLRGQELRQFTEAGIPMVQALADKFTKLNGTLVTTGEVFELISKRQVSFEMVKSVMEDMTNEGGKFYKMQENIVETLYGQVQKLGDVWTLSINKLGQSSGGVLMDIVHLLQKLAENIKPIFTGFVVGAFVKMLGNAPKWVAGLNSGFIQTKAQVADLNRRIAFLNTHMQRLKANGMAFTKSMQMANAQMRSLKLQKASLNAELAFGAAGLAIGLLVTGIEMATKRSREFNNALNDIDTSFQKDRNKLASGLDSIIDRLSTATKFSKEYNDAVSTLRLNYGDYVSDSIINQLLNEQNALRNTAEEWNNLRDSIIDAINSRKEYERHSARAEEAGKQLSSSAHDRPWYHPIYGQSQVESITDYAVSHRGDVILNRFLNPIFGESQADIDYKNANRAVYAAITDFTDNFKENYDKNNIKSGEDGSDLYELFFEDFRGYLKKQARSFSPNLQKSIDDAARMYFDAFFKGEIARTMVDETFAIINDDYHLNDVAFNRARSEAIKYDEGKFKGDSNEYKVQNDKSRSYDPFKYGINEDKEYIRALNERFNELELGLTDGMKLEGYREASNKFRQSIIESLFKFDESSTYRVANDLNSLLDRVSDSEMHGKIKNLLGLFIRFAGVKTGVSADISSNIHANYGGGSDYSAQQKDFFARFDPTEENVEANRNALREMYQKNLATIESHRNDSVWKDVVARLKQQNDWIKILAGKKYYDIVDLEKKSGGGFDREFPEFVNIFKDAYALYKRATTEGGMEAGVAKVKTDDAILDLFGDFFGTEGKIGAFKMNIGDKSIADIIKAARIEGGQEDQIVDFKKAAKETAEAMIKYGEADPDRRGHFIREGQRLLKWVADTFADDSVTKWLNELSKATENLTISFENMRADQDLARKMVANGTLDSSYFTVKGSKGAFPGMETLARPGSDIQRSFISNLLGEYNQWAAQAKDENGVNIATPFNFVKDIKDMNLDDIADALKQITDESDMNMQAFRATKEGNIMMNKLTAALKDLDKTVREEAAKVSGKSATGNSLYDSLFNAGINARASQMDNETIQRIANSLSISPDQVAAASRVESAKGSVDNVFKSFQTSMPFNALFHSSRKPIDISTFRERIKSLAAGLPDLEKFELDEKFKEMELKIQSFNASIGALEPFNNGAKDYLSADERAKKQWQKYVDKGKSLGADFVEGENRFDFSKLNDPEVIAQVQALNAALEKVGVNGKKLAIVFQKQALSNIADSAKAGEKALNDLSNVVRQTIQSTNAFINVFSKAYDVMNDGENPKWMQDAQAFMDDFSEAFEMAIAPIAAVLSLIIAITVATAILDTLLWPLLAIVAAAALFAGIMAAFQQHDRKLEHSIEGMKEDVESFDRAITNLQASAERSVGFEKLRKNIEATGKDLEKATAYAEMARLEEEKKNTDESKVKEYKQSYQEAMDSFLNGMREVRDELVSSTEDWANAMGSAIRNAFQNGENAARAFRDTVKTMIGDVIENMLEMAILQPLIESALENWTNSDYLRQKYTKEWTEKDENGNTIQRKSFDQDNYLKELLQNIGDPDKAENFYQSMLMIGDTLIDTVNGMPSVLQDFYKHNSELGTLSGGIESVTEDTARRIEALENSQLGEIFAIRTILEQYLGNSGGFGDSTMASVQAAVVSIASDTSVISRIMQSFENQLNELRTGPSRPLHVTMV